MTTLTFLCDTKRHLICTPYSVENLHKMAKELGIKRHWFHKNHYDIPKTMNERLLASNKVTIVPTKEIVRIIKNHI